VIAMPMCGALGGGGSHQAAAALASSEPQPSLLPYCVPYPTACWQPTYHVVNVPLALPPAAIASYLGSAPLAADIGSDPFATGLTNAWLPQQPVPFAPNGGPFANSALSPTIAGVVVPSVGRRAPKLPRLQSPQELPSTGPALTAPAPTAHGNHRFPGHPPSPPPSPPRPPLAKDRASRGGHPRQSEAKILDLPRAQLLCAAILATVSLAAVAMAAASSYAHAGRHSAPSGSADLGGAERDPHCPAGWESGLNSSSYSSSPRCFAAVEQVATHDDCARLCNDIGHATAERSAALACIGSADENKFVVDHILRGARRRAVADPSIMRTLACACHASPIPTPHVRRSGFLD
jgi:hypothetical protein